MIEQIRASSRSLARDWGFMGGMFAGAEMSPSAVHALIEIEQGDITAKDLSARLRLEKSSVSRLVKKLVEAGDVCESVNARASDSRLKPLSLTAAGRVRVAAIHAHARAQVDAALQRLKPGEGRAVSTGLALYSDALSLRALQSQQAPQAPQSSQARSLPQRPAVELATGYRLGLISRITQMHALYYARQAGFGQRFEAVVAAGLADFSGRMDRPGNRIWTALHAGEIVGSVAINGDDLGPGKAHLRWFIVDDQVRGSGAGRLLLQAAIAFCDERGFDETHLWTFSGLAAARHLYESLGFALAEEWTGTQWGKEVLEQRFVRPLRAQATAP